MDRLADGSPAFHSTNMASASEDCCNSTAGCRQRAENMQIRVLYSERQQSYVACQLYSLSINLHFNMTQFLFHGTWTLNFILFRY